MACSKDIALLVVSTLLTASMVDILSTVTCVLSIEGKACSVVEVV